jgi:hypothetical protein
MSQIVFEHLARLLQHPADAAKNQVAFDRHRLAAVERALRFRPQFWTLQHELPAAAQNAPIAESFETLQYPSVITGAITDGEDRNVRFYRQDRKLSLSNFGNEPNLKLSLDAIAGHNVATAGYAGVKKYAEPYALGERGYMTLEIYQETTPGALETVTTSFTGVRCYRPDHAEAQMSPGVRDAVKQAIAGRPSPETRYVTMKVEFDASGRATCQTPDDDEPMFILGHRSTFTDASVELGQSGTSLFSKEPLPIWALCAEDNNARDVWNMLDVPIFLPPREQIKYDLTNTVDTTSLLVATDGNIEALMLTM